MSRIKNKDDKIIVPFSGGKLNKDKANQAGIAIISGIIGVIISIALFGTGQRLFLRGQMADRDAAG